MDCIILEHESKLTLPSCGMFGDSEEKSNYDRREICSRGWGIGVQGERGETESYAWCFLYSASPVTLPLASSLWLKVYTMSVAVCWETHYGPGKRALLLPNWEASCPASSLLPCVEHWPEHFLH